MHNDGIPIALATTEATVGEVSPTWAKGLANRWRIGRYSLESLTKQTETRKLAT